MTVTTPYYLIYALLSVEWYGSRRGSRILKWGVNFCNNVIEPINICGIRRKEGERENKQLAVTNIIIRFPRMVYLT